MRALCTGAAGFLGSKLVPVLTERGHDVESIDREDGDLTFSGHARFLVEQVKPEVVVHRS